MAVHVHTGGGCGGYFIMEGSNPLLLDSVFNDPTLRKTNFVMLHGGAGGFEQLVAVSADETECLCRLLRADLDDLTAPHRGQHSLHAGVLSRQSVCSAPTSIRLTPQVNWEETGYQTETAGRTALAIALTGMMQDGEITRAQASAIAHMVLHDNAAKLYGLERSQAK